ncbi:MAG: hypothetical protein M1827_003603 [Pycnora praestabilis]|nr:MAG: hypothetical protein M1827_003603 [Pycnora praestabilis]
MSRIGYSNLPTPSSHPHRDSLELASLASSSPTSNRSSISSSPSGISSSRRASLDNEDPLSASNGTRGTRPIPHNRSYSVSSAFDFASNLFPLSSTAGSYAPLEALTSASDPHASLNGGSLEKHKSLTYLNGLSLVVGLIIGSGIFSSPSQVNINAGSPGASLIVWTVAGLLAWTGAASYAELGGAIPLNGGAQVYLAKIFGELAGFLFTWSAVCVLKPGSAAIIAIIFGEYVVRAVIGADAVHISSWISKGVALLGLVIVTVVNCVSTKLATKMGDTLMFFKFIALLGITVTGIVVAITGFSWKGEPNRDWKDRNWFDDTSTNVSNWAVALYAGLWAFDGWDNVNYVTGEFINPNRDLPRVLHSAMPLVIISYIMANIAYFFVLPLKGIESSNTVAVLFGSKVFGPIGSLVLALTVGASCFGALNATTFTSGRLVYVAGKEGYLPVIFGKLGIGGSTDVPATRLRTRSSATKRISRLIGDSESGLFFTPINAMLLNAGLTACYILVGEFGTLVTFYGVAGYTFYFLTVLGLIVLRIREPHLERPYRTWISTPIIFCCVSLFLLSRAVFAQPLQTAFVVAFILLGAPIFYWRIRGRDGIRKGRSSNDGTGWKFWKRWGRSRKPLQSSLLLNVREARFARIANATNRPSHLRWPFYFATFVIGVGAAVAYTSYDASPARRGVLSTSNFTPFTIVSKEPVSPTSSIFTLRPTKAPSSEKAYEHLWERCLWSVQVKQPQLQVARAYTPLPPSVLPQDATADKTGGLRFLIRKEAGGEVSGYLHKLPFGATMDLRGPIVEYEVPKDVEKVIFLAGGTGIAPALQVANVMLRKNGRLADEHSPSLHILWACRKREDCVGGVSSVPAHPDTTPHWLGAVGMGSSRSSADQPLVMSKQGNIVRELEALKSRFRGRLTVDYFVDEEGIFVKEGNITKYIQNVSASPKLRADVETNRPPEKNLVLVSGPDGFVDHLAGPKRWENGVEVQGRLGGLLAKVSLVGWEVWKL